MYFYKTSISNLNSPDIQLKIKNKLLFKNSYNFRSSVSALFLSYMYAGLRQHDAHRSSHNVIFFSFDMY